MMNAATMKRTTEGSLNGTMSFPDVVKTLAEAGVESYHVDLVQNRKTFYTPSGDVFEEAFAYKGPVAAAEFRSEAVVEAIRASQQKQITYVDFLKRILEAGATDYTVYIQGRKAIYFGRKGEFHVENFPQ
jgi:uncharacterized protein YbcV (DUF1398 family)